MYQQGLCLCVNVAKCIWIQPVFLLTYDWLKSNLPVRDHESESEPNVMHNVMQLPEMIHFKNLTH